MSDRTKVTDGTAEDAPTRADRVMGRAGGTSGQGGSAAPQRPAAVPAAEAAPTSQPGRPTDGWARTAPGAKPGSDDDTPTRVNPAVPPLTSPGGRGEAGAPARPAQRARQEPAQGGQPAAPATSGDTDTTRTLVGSGALGAVTSSMERPTATSTQTPATGETRPAARSASRRQRRARLRLSRIDPWSVMKTSFLFSIALGIAGWVAVAFVWWVIQTSGLFGYINTIVADMLSAPGDADPFRLEAYVNGSRVLGLTALLGVIDVLLMTALCTVASFLYNLSATMLGGLQVTLAETDD